MTMNNVFPAINDLSFEETKEKFSEYATKTLYEVFIKDQYIEFLQKLNIDHHKEIFTVFWEMRIEIFKTSSDAGKVYEKYIPRFIKACEVYVEEKK
ncbi:hypothetical protein M3184_21355 [Metabacillus litoralis]|nr:hypothetical protein [Metabacillus litoralis]